MVEIHLDCRQLKCPMPIVKIAISLRDLAVGDHLIVAATDPAFLADATAWSRMTGHSLEQLSDGEVKQIRVQKVHA